RTLGLFGTRARYPLRSPDWWGVRESPPCVCRPQTHALAEPATAPGHGTCQHGLASTRTPDQTPEERATSYSSRRYTYVDYRDPVYHRIAETSRRGVGGLGASRNTL